MHLRHVLFSPIIGTPISVLIAGAILERRRGAATRRPAKKAKGDQTHKADDRSCQLQNSENRKAKNTMGKIVTESSVGDARDHSELRKDAENSSKREGEDGRKDCGVLSKRKRAEDEIDRIGRDAKRRKILRMEDSNQVESSEVRLDSNISKEQETNESACTLIRGNEVKMKTFIPKDRNLQLQKNDDDDDNDGVDSKDDDTKEKSKEVGKKKRRRRQRKKRKNGKDLKSQEVLDDKRSEVIDHIEGLERTFYILDTCYSRSTSRSWPKQGKHDFNSLTDMYRECQSC